MLAPAALLRPAFGAYDSEAKLQGAVGRALVEYWRSGTSELPAGLTTLVDYWFAWHAIKVAISASSVIVLALLATALWHRYLRARGSATAATAATVVTVLAVGVLMANIQATAVPLVALLPLLSGTTADGRLAQVVSEIRERLTTSADPQAGSGALAVLLSEVARYHWVLAAVSATLLVALGLAGAQFWKRRTTGGPGATRVGVMRRTLGVIMILTACLLLLMTAASVVSALQPATALLDALGAG
ncbi:hypothetical protein Apa02nite_056020 [Actinoplanes palleronii]|uniref:Uncharacterized protein n=1 Tax=Actinoplanes palleronii TaxID=113570 RepID=A0ABQ4BFR4_9ACTN|nr:hypothetical protein Apa02nite_056020 [Actinoplanes palleronii]